MSEEDLIKQQLAKLFTEALLSDAAEEERSAFVAKIAAEVRQSLAGATETYSETIRSAATSAGEEFGQLIAREREDLKVVLAAHSAEVRRAAAISGGGRGKGLPAIGSSQPIEDDQRESEQADASSFLDNDFGVEPATDKSNAFAFARLFRPVPRWAWFIVVPIVLALILGSVVIAIIALTSSRTIDRPSDEKLAAICRELANIDDVERVRANGADETGDVQDNIISGAADPTDNAEASAADLPETGVVAGSRTARLVQLERLYAQACTTPESSSEQSGGGEAKADDVANGEAAREAMATENSGTHPGGVTKASSPAR